MQEPIDSITKVSKTDKNAFSAVFGQMITVAVLAQMKAYSEYNIAKGRRIVFYGSSGDDGRPWQQFEHVASDEPKRYIEGPDKPQKPLKYFSVSMDVRMTLIGVVAEFDRYIDDGYDTLEAMVSSEECPVFYTIHKTVTAMEKVINGEFISGDAGTGKDKLTRVLARMYEKKYKGDFGDISKLLCKFCKCIGWTFAGKIHETLKSTLNLGVFYSTVASFEMFAGIVTRECMDVLKFHSEEWKKLKENESIERRKQKELKALKAKNRVFVLPAFMNRGLNPIANPITNPSIDAIIVPVVKEVQHTVAPIVEEILPALTTVVSSPVTDLSKGCWDAVADEETVIEFEAPEVKPPVNGTTLELKVPSRVRNPTRTPVNRSNVGK